MTFEFPTGIAGAIVLLLVIVLGFHGGSCGLARFVLATAVALVGIGGLLFAGLLGPYGYAGGMVVLSLALKGRRHHHLTKLASARWAEPDDIEHLLDAGHGLPVGRLIAARPPLATAFRNLLNPLVAAEYACRELLSALGLVPSRRVVRLGGPHNLVIGPPGSGKTTAIIIQFILALAGGDASFFCLDIKGEISRICAPILRANGHNVYIIDHHQLVTQQGDTFDPVRGLRPGSPEVIEECKAISEDIVPHDSHEHEQHWPQTGKANLAASIAFVTEFGGEHRDLQTAIGTIMSREYRDKALKFMRESDKQGGLIARMADEISHAQGDELASILSTLGRHLSAFNTPAVVDSMASSSFRPQALKEAPTAAFFVIPPTHLKTERGLLRLWLGSTIRALLRDGLGGRTVHAIIDEAAAAGQMEAIDQALAVGRGYGINVHLCFQSMAQMEVCYPEGQARAVLAQTSQVYFGVQDVDTGEHVSKSLGAQTLVIEGGGASSGTSKSWQHGGSQPDSGSTSSSSNSNSNWSLQQRPLLHATEVMSLPRNLAVSICASTPPILTELVPYFADPALCAPRPSVAPTALAVGLCLLALAAWLVNSVP